MSVRLSLELLVTGSVTDLKDFWSALNPKNEKLSTRHFQSVLGQVVDDQTAFDGFEVQFDASKQAITVSWCGGFGDFDRGFHGSTFRDWGVELSEKFQTLDFTLYFDSHGEEFAGGYSHEVDDDGRITETVFAGGIRYRCGVRIGEKTLTQRDYFTQDENEPDDADDSDFEGEEFEVAVPDYENNRQKIDTAIANGELRSSTQYFRWKWLQEALKEGDISEAETIVMPGEMSFRRSFWQEVPLINTEAQYIDKAVARAAVEQCPHAAVFVPTELLSTRELDALRGNEYLEALIGCGEDSDTIRLVKVQAVAMCLLLELTRTELALKSLKASSDENEVETGNAGARLTRLVTSLTNAIEQSDPVASKKIIHLFNSSFGQATVDQTQPKLLIQKLRPAIAGVIRVLCCPLFD